MRPSGQDARALRLGLDHLAFEFAAMSSMPLASHVEVLRQRRRPNRGAPLHQRGGEVGLYRRFAAVCARLEQQTRGVPADLPARLADARQGDRTQCGEGRVVPRGRGSAKTRGLYDLLSRAPRRRDLEQDGIRTSRRDR